MTNHDELCEKVFKSKPTGLAQDWNKGYDQGLRHCREDFKDALSSGLLKLSGSCEGMTVEEIHKIVDDFCETVNDLEYGLTSSDCLLIAKAIHAQMTGAK